MSTIWNVLRASNAITGKLKWIATLKTKNYFFSHFYWNFSNQNSFPYCHISQLFTNSIQIHFTSSRLDFVLVIDFICVKTKSCASTTTKSDWCLHRLEITPWWSAMQIQLPRIHHHHTQRAALAICQMETMWMAFRPCNSKWWQWIKRSHLTSINRLTFSSRRCSTMITTTTTIPIMVQPMVVAAA